jgi:16S rRNA (cytosine1402-N4)-methyltransferase
MEIQQAYHQPVLLHECIENLCIKPDGVYIDATFGGGGHSRAILEKLGTKGKLIAFDQDKDAQQNIPAQENRLLFIPENFIHLSRFLRLYNITRVDGILADLGVSSHQFDNAERGFSIRFDAALDMRMDNRTKITAAQVVNTMPEKELHKIFEQYGEVTNSRTLAATIAASRKNFKVETIAQFKTMIQQCVKGNPNKYFAQVFQALRIEVNQELQVLENFCHQAIAALSPKGRLCMISFHSLEDRVVKQCFKGQVEKSEVYNPFAHSVVHKTLHQITSKPITASEEELKNNTRSRSAKLRVAEKI